MAFNNGAMIPGRRAFFAKPRKSIHSKQKDVVVIKTKPIVEKVAQPDFSEDQKVNIKESAFVVVVAPEIEEVPIIKEEIIEDIQEKVIALPPIEEENIPESEDSGPETIEDLILEKKEENEEGISKWENKYNKKYKKSKYKKDESLL